MGQRVRKPARSRRSSRRRFLKLATLGGAGLVADALLPMQALASAAELQALRQSICSAEAQLAPIVQELFAAGMPLHLPAPPIPAFRLDQLREQARNIAIQLCDDLRPHSPEFLQQLIAPEFLPMARMATSYGASLVPTTAEIQTHLFAPAVLAGADLGCAGWVVMGVLISALTGLATADVKGIINAIMEGDVLKYLDEMVEAIRKDDMKKARGALRNVLEAIGAALKKLGGEMVEKIIQAVAKKLAAGWFSFGLFVVAFIMACYDNWDDIKTHILGG
uniref:Twin-arginine translocation signal domain-containing protein n=1 Tax=Eiseniibacteriota bacterium TaxID=2212470 RepID=A0A832I0S0_UNCEI